VNPLRSLLELPRSTWLLVGLGLASARWHWAAVLLVLVLLFRVAWNESE